MKKILIVTAIKPDYLNKGGPSGVLWEMIEILKQDFSIEILLKEPKSKFGQKLNQLGVGKKIIDKRLETVEIILVYPSFVLNLIEQKYWRKAYLLGPDATSFLFARLFKIASGFSKLKYIILTKWFIFLENHYAAKIKKFIVVGEKDRKWLVKNGISKEKISFLSLPLLNSSLNENFSENKGQKRYILAGDLSYKYIGDFLFKVKVELSKNNILGPIRMIVVGKNNFWVYRLFKEISWLVVDYKEWIEDYRDICNLNDVHLVPLKAGAGTKNRVLTACANGLKIISTQIGIENIRYLKNCNYIIKANDHQQFAKAMINVLDLDEKNSLDIFKFRNDINNDFKKDLKKIFEY